MSPQNRFPSLLHPKRTMLETAVKTTLYIMLFILGLSLMMHGAVHFSPDGDPSWLRAAQAEGEDPPPGETVAVTLAPPPPIPQSGEGLLLTFLPNGQLTPQAQDELHAFLQTYAPRLRRITLQANPLASHLDQRKQVIWVQRVARLIYPYHQNIEIVFQPTNIPANAVHLRWEEAPRRVVSR